MTPLARLRGWLATLPPMGVDAVLAGVFTLLELWQLSAFSDPDFVERSGLDYQGLTPWIAVLVVAAHVPLIWRQWAPVTVLTLVTIPFFVGSFALHLPLAGWGMLAALYEVAVQRDRRTSLLALALITIGFLVGLGFTPWTEDEGLPDRLGGAVYLVSIAATPWGLGYWAGVRRERVRRLERERTERAQQAVTAERARVARELHDILAHSVSVMVLQASGAREMLPGNPERAMQALAQIEATGRQSMVEVRRMLGILRGQGVEPDLHPQPGLEQLDDLVAQVRDAGLRVHVTVTGERRALDPSVDLSAYRILQEALTNVLKHAGPATVTVGLAYTSDTLRLEVSDDGAGGAARARAAQGQGNGLLGMRERAALVGGELTAGPREEGGFRVVATLPVAAATAPAAVVEADERAERGSR